MILGAAGGSLIFLQSLEFPRFQFVLTMLGGFNGICSSLESGSLYQVAPAIVPVGRVLTLLQPLQFGFCGFFSPHNNQCSCRLVGTTVVTNDSVTTGSIIVFQE